MKIKKGCPFCGRRIPIVSRECCWIKLKCEGCGAEGPPTNNIIDSMKLWDRRKKQESLPKGKSILSFMSPSQKGLYATFEKMREEEDAQLGHSDGNNNDGEID